MTLSTIVNPTEIIIEESSTNNNGTITVIEQVPLAPLNITNQTHVIAKYAFNGTKLWSTSVTFCSDTIPSNGHYILLDPTIGNLVSDIYHFPEDTVPDKIDDEVKAWDFRHTKLYVIPGTDEDITTTAFSS
ncbi:hypothetical protein HDV00_006109 [Rhizophlyctis rosea]|nr:hypothetical protein HDV00_006109 [Rhizophlyctis rosea]